MVKILPALSCPSEHPLVRPYPTASLVLGDHEDLKIGRARLNVLGSTWIRSSAAKLITSTGTMGPVHGPHRIRSPSEPTGKGLVEETLRSTFCRVPRSSRRPEA